MSLTQRAFAGGVNTEFGSLASLLTTGNSYADVGTWFTQHLKTKHLAFAATTNDLKVQILGSLDGGATYPLTLEAEFTLTAGAAPTSKTITTYCTHVNPQVKPAAGGAHGTLATQIAGANF